MVVFLGRKWNKKTIISFYFESISIMKDNIVFCSTPPLRKQGKEQKKWKKEKTPKFVRRTRNFAHHFSFLLLFFLIFSFSDRLSFSFSSSLAGRYDHNCGRPSRGGKGRQPVKEKYLEK